MTVVCIHQPDFVPYLGFFDRLLQADHFIVLDDVQFIRRGWHHRDLIKTAVGPSWLTISLQKGDYKQKISEVILSQDTNWRQDNLNLLRQNYKSALHFDYIFTMVEKIYLERHERLLDFNLAFLNLALRLFRIKINMSFASSYSVPTTGTRRLVDLVLSVKGSDYLTGVGSLDYLDQDLFERRGLKVSWQNFEHPIYEQCFNGFDAGLSCLDVFFNYGDESYKVLNRL